MSGTVTPACFASFVTLIGVDSAQSLLSVICLILHTWNFFFNAVIRIKLDGTSRGVGPIYSKAF
jgi:hypothetical protein